MKRILYYFLFAFVTFISFCSKKNDPPAEAEKPKGYFLTSIKCTYPASDTNRNSAFVYDNNNRIEEFTFNMTDLKIENKFSYNENDLITQVVQTRTTLSTGAKSEEIHEFKYAARILNEYISNGTSYLVVYNAASKMYTVFNISFSLDPNNNLKKIDYDSGNRLTIDYLSDTGIFRSPQDQIASYILARDMFIYYFQDIYAFSKNEISALSENGTPYIFSSIRDDSNNIVQTDIKNAGNNLVRRYQYTYELQELK